MCGRGFINSAVKLSLISVDVFGQDVLWWETIIIPSGLLRAHHFSTVGLADVMAQKFNFKDYNLGSPSVISSVHFDLSE